MLRHRVLAACVCVLGFILGCPRMVAAEQQRPLLRDFIGLNGHTVQFKPDLYAPVSRLVRDYHPVSWDLGTNTSEPPPFPFAKNRVDWSKVYGSWRKKELSINASLQVEFIKVDRWKHLERDAYAYGLSFSREFGSQGRKLVEAAEIGNEPGDWSDADYTRVFRAMAKGLREGDPDLKIVTCNLTTGKSGKYEKSVECIRAYPELYDVLNIHSYAQLENWPTWRRSFPEDSRLPKYLKDIEDLCRWRDQHAPGKPVWITEFGYDSTTKPSEKSGDFSKWVGVTDEQQAQWLVRSLLLFSTMPVERAYIYFFNDRDEPKLHSSSGLTRNFAPKPSYHAVSQLQRALGDYRFERILTNATGVLRVHEYRHGADPDRFAWIAWAPTHAGAPATHLLPDPGARLAKVERMALAAEDKATPPHLARQREDRTLEVQASGSPVYLFFSK